MDLGHIPEECIGFRARAAARAVNKVLDARLQAVGLRATQFSVLVALNQQPESSVAMLARTLDIEDSTLLRNVSVLKRDGLAASNGKRGRAGQALRLTAEGSVRLRIGAKIWRKIQNEIAAELGAKTNRTREALRDIERAARVLQDKETA